MLSRAGVSPGSGTRSDAACRLTVFLAPVILDRGRHRYSQDDVIRALYLEFDLYRHINLHLKSAQGLGTDAVTPRLNRSIERLFGNDAGSRGLGGYDQVYLTSLID